MKTPNSKVSRKSFIKGAAASGALLTLGSSLKPVLRAFAQSKRLKSKTRGQWIGTTCQGCTSWCSVQVYITEGRAINQNGRKHKEAEILFGAKNAYSFL